MNTRNFSKAQEAVSPVVATLLLVLVAAGAAIGFGVFLNGFQKNTQENVSSETPAETLRIGGSSTVWEFTEKVIPSWDAAHPSINIENQEGGSGVGKQAICKGLIDIGASSSAVPASGKPGQDLATCPDQNGDSVKDAGAGLKITTVAYDAVVFAYSTATHDANCPTAAVINLSGADIKEIYAVNAGGQTATVSATLPAATGAGGKYAWKDLNTGSIATPAFACTGTAVITLGERSDQGGTEDGFCAKFFGSQSYTRGSFTGKACVSGTGQLEPAIFSDSVGSLGNDGIRNWLKATSNSASFIGYGSVAEAGSGLSQGKMSDVTPSAANIKSAGVSECLPAATSSTQFCSARSLIYITIGEPSATEQLYLDFVTNTLNNQLFAKNSGYISIYA